MVMRDIFPGAGGGTSLFPAPAQAPDPDRPLAEQAAAAAQQAQAAEQPQASPDVVATLNEIRGEIEANNLARGLALDPDDYPEGDIRVFVTNLRDAAISRDLANIRALSQTGDFSRALTLDPGELPEQFRQYAAALIAHARESQADAAEWAERQERIERERLELQDRASQIHAMDYAAAGEGLHPDNFDPELRAFAQEIADASDEGVRLGEILQRADQLADVEDSEQADWDEAFIANQPRELREYTAELRDHAIDELARREAINTMEAWGMTVERAREGDADAIESIRTFQPASPALPSTFVNQVNAAKAKVAEWDEITALHNLIDAEDERAPAELLTFFTEEYVAALPEPYKMHGEKLREWALGDLRVRGIKDLPEAEMAELDPDDFPEHAQEYVQKYVDYGIKWRDADALIAGLVDEYDVAESEWDSHRDALIAANADLAWLREVDFPTLAAISDSEIDRRWGDQQEIATEVMRVREDWAKPMVEREKVLVEREKEFGSRLEDKESIERYNKEQHDAWLALPRSEEITEDVTTFVSRQVRVVDVDAISDWYTHNLRLALWNQGVADDYADQVAAYNDYLQRARYHAQALQEQGVDLEAYGIDLARYQEIDLPTYEAYMRQYESDVEGDAQRALAAEAANESLAALRRATGQVIPRAEGEGDIYPSPWAMPRRSQETYVGPDGETYIVPPGFEGRLGNQEALEDYWKGIVPAPPAGYSMGGGMFGGAPVWLMDPEASEVILGAGKEERQAVADAITKAYITAFLSDTTPGLIPEPGLPPVAQAGAKVAGEYYEGLKGQADAIVDGVPVPLASEFANLAGAIAGLPSQALNLSVGLLSFPEQYQQAQDVVATANAAGIPITMQDLIGSDIVNITIKQAGPFLSAGEAWVEYNLPGTRLQRAKIKLGDLETYLADLPDARTPRVADVIFGVLEAIDLRTPGEIPIRPTMAIRYNDAFHNAFERMKNPIRDWSETALTEAESGGLIGPIPDLTVIVGEQGESGEGPGSRLPPRHPDAGGIGPYGGGRFDAPPGGGGGQMAMAGGGLSRTAAYAITSTVPDIQNILTPEQLDQIWGDDPILDVPGVIEFSGRQGFEAARQQIRSETGEPATETHTILYLPGIGQGGRLGGVFVEHGSLGALADALDLNPQDTAALGMWEERQRQVDLRRQIEPLLDERKEVAVRQALDAYGYTATEAEIADLVGAIEVDLSTVTQRGLTDPPVIAGFTPFSELGQVETDIAMRMVDAQVAAALNPALARVLGPPGIKQAVVQPHDYELDIEVEPAPAQDVIPQVMTILRDRPFTAPPSVAPAPLAVPAKPGTLRPAPSIIAHPGAAPVPIPMTAFPDIWTTRTVWEPDVTEVTRIVDLPVPDAPTPVGPAPALPTRRVKEDETVPPPLVVRPLEPTGPPPDSQPAPMTPVAPGVEIDRLTQVEIAPQTGPAYIGREVGIGTAPVVEVGPGVAPAIGPGPAVSLRPAFALAPAVAPAPAPVPTQPAPAPAPFRPSPAPSRGRGEAIAREGEATGQHAEIVEWQDGRVVHRLNLRTGAHSETLAESHAAVAPRETFRIVRFGEMRHAPKDVIIGGETVRVTGRGVNYGRGRRRNAPVMRERAIAG